MILRKFICTITIHYWCDKTHGVFISHLSGRKRIVFLFCNFPLCSVVVYLVAALSVLLDHYRGWIQKQRLSLNKHLRQDRVFWLDWLMWWAGDERSDVSLLYSTTRTYTRGTVVFQRMLKTNSDVGTLINPAFWWLSANRIVRRRWRNVPFAGVVSAP